MIRSVSSPISISLALYLSGAYLMKEGQKPSSHVLMMCADGQVCHGHELQTKNTETFESCIFFAGRILSAWAQNRHMVTGVTLLQAFIEPGQTQGRNGDGRGQSWYAILGLD